MSVDTAVSPDLPYRTIETRISCKSDQLGCVQFYLTTGEKDPRYLGMADPFKCCETGELMGYAYDAKHFANLEAVASYVVRQVREQIMEVNVGTAI